MPHSKTDTRWLSDEEVAAWRTISRAVAKLSWALECQLQQDSGLSFIEYHALAMLSEQPSHALRMSELAEITNASLSRLSHLVTRLERRGLVRREPDPDNGRFINAILTDEGWAKLVDSAPGHVTAVRELVLDAFTPAEIQQMGDGAQRVIDRIAKRS